VSAVVGIARADDKANEADQKALQGVWVAESMENAGQAAAKPDGRAVELTFKDNIFSGGPGKDVTFKLDASQKPKHIQLTRSVDGKEESVLGIYELNGDTLKICIDEGGKERPTEFKTTAGTKQALIVLKRKAK
jgi:uncharacterized protein (TIGR03067 family)